VAHLQKITIVRYVDGQGNRVPKGTPRAKKVKEKSDRWYAVWRENGKQVRTPLCVDKTAAQAMLTDLLRKKERGEAGLIDPYEQHKQKPLQEHVDSYLADLAEQGRTPKHVRNATNALARVLKLCKFNNLSDLNGDKLDTWLASLKRSARTKNWYREHILAFGAWLVRKKRLADNPFRNTTRANGEVKRKRRALALKELLVLLATARHRPLWEAMTIRRGTRKGERSAKVKPEVQARLERYGHEKYLLYKTAILTGLRRGELRKLEVRHLHLDGPEPFLHLPGKLPDGSRGTKNGNDAWLPLTVGHAQELRDLVAGKDRGDKVFEIPDPSRSIAALQRDLVAAGIPYRDEDGRYYDFHSFRVQTDSLLHQGKVHPRLIQLFMRHADANLTEHYDDAALHDLRKALDVLPSLDLHPEAGVAEVSIEQMAEQLALQATILWPEMPQEVKVKVAQSLVEKWLAAGDR
jgi:integrase